MQILCFYKLRDCGNPGLNKPISAIFPIAFSRFVFLCHIGNSHNILIFSHCICYSGLWSVILDVTIVFVFRRHKPLPYKMVSLVNKYVCSNCSNYSTDCSFISLHLLRPQHSLRNHDIEMRPISNPKMTFLCCERKSGTTLTLNQKLDNVRLHEEGMWKAETG